MAEYVVEFGKDGRPVEPDGRLDAPAFHRNHAADLGGAADDSSPADPATCWRPAAAPASMWSHFARHTPGIIWWPSDLNEQHLKSIEAWRAHAGLPNIRPPLRIDLSDPDWCAAMHDGSGPPKLLAVFCANVIHIAPWRVAEGLFAGAGALSARRRPAVSLRPVQARRQAHRGSATPCSTPACARTIRNGACAISPISKKLAATNGLRLARDRRDAGQQSDPGVRPARARLTPTHGPRPLAPVDRRGASLHSAAESTGTAEARAETPMIDVTASEEIANDARVQAPMWCGLPRRRR